MLKPRSATQRSAKTAELVRPDSGDSTLPIGPTLIPPKIAADILHAKTWTAHLAVL